MSEHERVIKPANAMRVATEAGPKIFRLYEEVGLIVYREEIKVGKTIMVGEGYIKQTVLPNGRKLYDRVQTRLITRKEAEDND